MFLFKKKIICQNCNQNFRGTTERGKRKYICSGYHNKKSCERWIIHEKKLIEIIMSHHQITKIKELKVIGKGKWSEDDENELEEVLTSVEVVLVNPTSKEITIQFRDGTKAFMSDNRQTYWTDEK